MATSLLALLDDISAVLDDVATMTKIATKKTAGVLGDDLALNAEQVAGSLPDRELAVVYGVAKGSAVNKAILVPGALAISAWLPFLITPLMILGGTFLCFEGVEKLIEGWGRRREAAKASATALSSTEAQLSVAAQSAPPASKSFTEKELRELETVKIRGAVRTDLILSAEIIVISLDAVTNEPFAVRALTLVVVSILATIGIYGLVGGIVKLDDLGLLLQKKSNALVRNIGSVLLTAAPKLMRVLSVVGTVAVFLVGGGIVSHSIDRLKRWSLQLETRMWEIEGIGQILAWLAPPVFDMLVGLLLGGASAMLYAGGRKVLKRTPAEV
jgi:uncharacterized protein